MTQRGFILGKFMPPHRGHIFLCETAMKMVDELTVLVCSTNAEPIPGDLRFRWMKEATPGANILHMHRDILQAPEDHPDFWPIWRAAIKEHHPQQIDLVFGSEPYVFRLAEECGAKPALIDPDREIFNVSGSTIRENPATHWADIAKPARTYFQNRLCLLGPESVGKSVLATALAAEFQTRVMPEYGRTYDVQYKQGKNWTEADLISLAKTHIAMREALVPDAGPLLIEDTDAVQTAIWAEHLLGARSALLDDMSAWAPADHYFVLSPDVAWTNDGVRYAGGDDTRQWFFDAAIERLAKLSLPYDVISGKDWDQRTQRAIDLAKNKFPTSIPIN